MWVRRRRETCKTCPHNTENQVKKSLSLKVRIIKSLSDFYSWITFNKDVDVLGNCTACEICSIYYKTAEKDETCPKKLWK